MSTHLSWLATCIWLKAKLQRYQLDFAVQLARTLHRLCCCVKSTRRKLERNVQLITRPICLLGTFPKLLSKIRPSNKNIQRTYWFSFRSIWLARLRHLAAEQGTWWRPSLKKKNASGRILRLIVGVNLVVEPGPVDCITLNVWFVDCTNPAFSTTSI